MRGGDLQNSCVEIIACIEVFQLRGEAETSIMRGGDLQNSCLEIIACIEAFQLRGEAETSKNHALK